MSQWILSYHSLNTLLLALVQHFQAGPRTFPFTWWNWFKKLKHAFAATSNFARTCIISIWQDAYPTKDSKLHNISSRFWGWFLPAVSMLLAFGEPPWAWSMLSRGRRRITTIEAIALHESVSPDKWCVTYADLKFLRRQVLTAIQQGLILSASPTSSDGESKQSEDDDEFGPSIYVVNEQYIKPITAQAGKMSWALMMNPDGLDCDLFVSHAWQEGIFEFLSKVLSSWPTRARHAWCCMLANPQNLNIGSMLQSPKTSPFALALQESRYVLVVPNRQQSVYCRLWCGYEAYVASEKAKIIQIVTWHETWINRRFQMRIYFWMP